jgi:hypothetical protein
MAEYFQNPKDLEAWVRSRGSAEEAAQELMKMIETVPDMSEIPDDEQDIHDSCQAILEQGENSNASEILFGVLAKHDITKLTKQATAMKKESSDPRQRNEWTRSSRNKWNRVVDAYNENTPWRVGRDKYYDFTHYATDEIRFDEDPHHIYSGESIWRTYVMDKFYRDYKDNDGKVVGGYINDRFHVFPTAGTPANPDAPRDGGNQMELADGERTRKPRPHQYSTERRLEEARDNKADSITVAADSFEKVVKVASNKNLKEAEQDRIYHIFKDTIEMREAGVEYETMVDSICDHYRASVMGVAQIDQVAQRLVSKHAGIGYEAVVKKAETLQEMLEHAGTSNIKVTDQNGAYGVLSGDANQQIYLDPGAMFVNVPNVTNVFEIVDHPVNANLVGSRVSFANMDFEVASTTPIQDVATEIGLNEDDQEAMAEAALETQNAEPAYGQDFAVTELQPS